MSGFKTIMGVRKESGYRARVAVGTTGDKVLLKSESIEQDYQDILHEYLYGSAGVPGSQRVFKPSGGSVEVDVCYTVKNVNEFVSMDTLLGLAMGKVTWHGGSEANRITFQDDLAVFGTIAWDKSQHATEVWQAESCYIKSFSLTCNSGENMTATFEISPYNLYIDDTTNTVTILAGLPTDLPDLVMFSDFQFRIGDQGGVLESVDLVEISGFTLNVNNNLTDHEQTTVASSGHTDIFQPIQPKRNGFREITLEITIPRYTSDIFQNFRTSDTNLQCDILGTGPSVGGSEEFDIIFPNLKIEPISAPVAGAEVINQTITFRCFKRNSASDMEWSTYGGTDNDNGEVWFELDNDRDAVISGF